MCVSLRKQRTTYAAAIVRALWGTLTSVASHSLFLKYFVPEDNYLDIANVTFLNESHLEHPLRGSAMNQCNKLHLLYRLTSERI